MERISELLILLSRVEMTLVYIVGCTVELTTHAVIIESVEISVDKMDGVIC